MRRLIAALLFILPVAGPALASPAMTVMPTVMRQSPSSHSAVLQSIPANAQIDVSGCGAVWCTASWRDISGFVPARAVAADQSAPPPEYYGAPPPVVIAPVPFYFGGYGYGHHWRHYY
jgi:uncharacterized protein YraI